MLLNRILGLSFCSPPAPANVTVKDSKPFIHQSERECLALNMYFEARNQDWEGIIAVGLVTLNRVADSRFPDISPGRQLANGNHFLALFPLKGVSRIRAGAIKKNPTIIEQRHEKVLNVPLLDFLAARIAKLFSIIF